MIGRRLHKYLHEYDFPYHDYLVNNLNFIDNIYEKGINEALENKAVNVPFYGNSIFYFLNEKLNEIVLNNYYVDQSPNRAPLGIYKQVHTQTHVYSSHNHIDTNDSIIGVFYINPPKFNEGGELILHPGPTYDDHISILPEPNKLYLFPSWVFHHVNPQTSTLPRYSLNWGFPSHNKKPIHKITGDIW
jgi:hypothetical protein